MRATLFNFVLNFRHLPFGGFIRNLKNTPLKNSHFFLDLHLISLTFEQLFMEVNHFLFLRLIPSHQNLKREQIPERPFRANIN